MHHIINSIRSARERFTMDVEDKDGNILDDSIAFTCGKAAAWRVTVVEAVDTNLDGRTILNSFTTHMSAVKRVFDIKKNELEELEEEQRKHPGHYNTAIYRAQVLHDRSKRELDDLVHYFSHWNEIPRITLRTVSVIVPARVEPELFSAATPAQAPWTLDYLSPQQRRYSK